MTISLFDTKFKNVYNIACINFIVFCNLTLLYDCICRIINKELWLWLWLPYILFADDLVLLAESRNELQDAIDQVSEYC